MVGTLLRKPAVLCVMWALFTVVFADHLFDIPGLIARHHEGYITRALGPWFAYLTSGTMVVLSGWNTVLFAKVWLRSRAAARQVEGHVS